MAEKYSDRVLSIVKDYPVVTGILATAVLGVAWYLQTNLPKLYKIDVVLGHSMISALGKPLGQEEHLLHGRKSIPIPLEKSFKKSKTPKSLLPATTQLTNYTEATGA